MGDDVYAQLLGAQLSKVPTTAYRHATGTSATPLGSMKTHGVWPGEYTLPRLYPGYTPKGYWESPMDQEKPNVLYIRSRFSGVITVATDNIAYIREMQEPGEGGKSFRAVFLKGLDTVITTWATADQLACAISTGDSSYIGLVQCDVNLSNLSKYFLSLEGQGLDNVNVIP